MDEVIWFIENIGLIFTLPLALGYLLGILILIISPLIPIVFQISYWLKYYKYNDDIEKSPRLAALRVITRKSYLNIAFVFVLLLPLFNRCETNFEEAYKVAETSLTPSELEHAGEDNTLAHEYEYQWNYDYTNIKETKLGKIDVNDSIQVYHKSIHAISGFGLIKKGAFNLGCLFFSNNLAKDLQEEFGGDMDLKLNIGPLIDNNVAYHGILNESTDNQSSDDIYALPLRDLIILICFNLIILFYILWVHEIFWKVMTLFKGFKEEEEIKVNPHSFLPIIMLILYLVLILTFLFTGVFSTLRFGAFIFGFIIFIISVPSLNYFLARR